MVKLQESGDKIISSEMIDQLIKNNHRKLSVNNGSVTS